MINTVLSCILPLHGVKELEINCDKFKQSMCLTGNESNVQTAMLFQACLSLVTSKREAIFICKYQFKDIPFMVKNMPKPETERLKFVKFKYFQTVDEIIAYLSKIHLEVNKPSIIVVDGMHNYITNDDCSLADRHFKVALLSAHLKNTIEFIQSKHTLCMGLVSCSQLEKPAFLSLYFDSIFHLNSISDGKEYQLEFKSDEIKANIQLILEKPFIVMEKIILIK